MAEQVAKTPSKEKISIHKRSQVEICLIPNGNGSVELSFTGLVDALGSAEDALTHLQKTLIWVEFTYTTYPQTDLPDEKRVICFHGSHGAIDEKEKKVKVILKLNKLNRDYEIRLRTYLRKPNDRLKVRRLWKHPFGNASSFYGHPHGDENVLDPLNLASHSLSIPHDPIPIFKTGQAIRYRSDPLVNNAGKGVILEGNEETHGLIVTVQDKRRLGIVKVHVKDIFAPFVYLAGSIDLSTSQVRRRAIANLLMKIRPSQSILNVYGAVCEALAKWHGEIFEDIWEKRKKGVLRRRDVFFPHGMAFNRRIYECHESLDDRCVSELIGMHVCGYLWGSEFEWKLNCPLDCGAPIKASTLWSFKLKKYGNGHRFSRTLCDVCVNEFHWNEFILTCQGETGHYICVSCIDKLIRCEADLIKLLTDLIGKELNRDCISELVSFVFGHFIQIPVTHSL